jgi:hypothetical protein
MGRIAVDLRNVDAAGDFPVYPAGEYTLEVKKVDQAVSKNSGEGVLRATFTIIDGPDGSTEYEGKSMVRSYSLQLKALPFLKRFVLACGLDPDQLADLDDELLIGAHLLATVTEREYNGRMGNDIGNERASGAVSDISPAPTGLSAPA